MKPLLKSSFNFFLGSLTAKMVASSTAIMLLCAFMTKPVGAEVPSFTDVNATRWSAAMIEWAKLNGIMQGYSDGTFRPTQTVTRAELMAVLRKAIQYADEGGGISGMVNKQQPIAFSDISNHWAKKTITEMSVYCGVATPVNETGNAFSPNLGTRRNYAAAATLRLLNCLRGVETKTKTIKIKI